MASFILEWDDLSSNANVEGFRVQYRIPSQTLTWTNYSPDLTGNTHTDYTVTGFDSNYEYDFRVVTLCEYNSGSTSEVVKDINVECNEGFEDFYIYIVNNLEDPELRFVALSHDLISGLNDLQLFRFIIKDEDGDVIQDDITGITTPVSGSTVYSYGSGPLTIGRGFKGTYEVYLGRGGKFTEEPCLTGEYEDTFCYDSSYWDSEIITNISETSISIDVSETSPSTAEDIDTSVEIALYQDSTFIESHIYALPSASIHTFTDLSPNTEYTIVLTWHYTINEKEYTNMGSCEHTVTTESYPCPEVFTVGVTSKVDECNGNDAGSMTLSVSGTSDPVEYSIDGGTTWQSSASFTGLSAGSYSLKARLQSSPSCESNNPSTSIFNREPNGTASGTTTVCVGATAPVVTFTQTGTGTASYQFKYRVNGGATQTVSGSATATVTMATGTAGVFTFELLEVIDANGCSSGPITGQSAVITVEDCSCAIDVRTEVDASAVSTIQITDISFDGSSIGYTYPLVQLDDETETISNDGTGDLVITYEEGAIPINTDIMITLYINSTPINTLYSADEDGTITFEDVTFDCDDEVYLSIGGIGI